MAIKQRILLFGSSSYIWLLTPRIMGLNPAGCSYELFVAADKGESDSALREKCVESFNNWLKSRYGLQSKCDGTRWCTGGGEWRENWRMEWVASTLHTTSEHGVSSITTADTHTSAASSRLNWRLRRFKWTRTFRRKTKSGLCACAITFQLASTNMQ